MTQVQMPQLGETIIEGTILKWLKKEGDSVERDEPIFEISTDKVDTEVPSPVAGTVSKILVEEGATVPVGTALMEIDDGGSVESDSGQGASAPVPTEGSTPEAAPTQEPPRPQEPAPAPQAPPTPQPASVPQAAPAPVAPPQPVAAAATHGEGAVATLPDRGPRSRILSPVVRRLATEHRIDLSLVAGSGEGGRITRRDIEAAIAGGGAAAAAQASVPEPAPPPTPVAAPVAVGAQAGETAEPMTHIRKAIADHMVASVQTTARAWTMVEANVEHVVRLRERAKEGFEQKHGVKLTYLPFVVRASVDALQTFPQVNSRLAGDEIVTPRAVHMGIAVSYDAGLIVPVIKNADAMNSVGIARAIADLAARARSHQLQPDEVQGATFTITNPGPYGSLLSVPIINLPNVGILSIDGIQKRPVVVEDDAIAVRHMVYISMSWDHRVIDGELATRFLARVKQNLETWDFAEDLGL